MRPYDPPSMCVNPTKKERQAGVRLGESHVIELHLLKPSFITSSGGCYAPYVGSHALTQYGLPCQPQFACGGLDRPLGLAFDSIGSLKTTPTDCVVP